MNAKKSRRALVAGILLGAVLALGINSIGNFLTSHHQEERNCHQVPEGRMCDLVWVHN
jgi:hypothetical protein